MPGVLLVCVSLLCACVRCTLTIADRLFRRCSLVDLERPSSDESIVEARRDALPVARSQTLEYAVHGKFRTREGGAAFPDTFWFSLNELRAAGCSTADLRAHVGSFEEELAAASEEVLCALSEEEDEDEDEDETRTPSDGDAAGGRGEVLASTGGNGAEAGAEARDAGVAQLPIPTMLSPGI